MIKTGNNYTSSAPGRICLFGEHQDYLNLPVIPAAISKRIKIFGNKSSDKKIRLELPDIKDFEEFKIDGIQEYIKERDYLRSSFNVLIKNGFSFSEGFNGTVIGDIPINSGTSSSSALIIAWINILTQISDQQIKLNNDRVGELAFEAEVTEFGEPGGKMDHYSCALGGLTYLEFFPSIKIEKLPNGLGAFVLGDSLEPKNTTEILSRVKGGVLEAVKKIRTMEKAFEIKKSSIKDIDRFKEIITSEEYELLCANISNYKITQKAKALLSSESFNEIEFGNLLNEHHKNLSDKLKISTDKIDRMIKSALEAGAYGAKINGSGGGGCMFAYAPKNPKEVAESIIAEGGKAYIINIDSGVV